MFANATLKAAMFVTGLLLCFATIGSCQSQRSHLSSDVAIGALPEMVMALQEEPKSDFSSTVLNPPRSTFKFTGKTVKLVTQIETREPISFTISEDYPGDPGSDSKFSNYNVVFGPDPSQPGMVARGELHQSNPYFLVESGWAYFAGSGAMGETGRVRTSPETTEYFIQIDQSDPKLEVHRVINVSANSTHKVRIVCPATDTGAVIHTVNACYYAEINNDNCVISGQGHISGSDAVRKFLESVGSGDLCPPP